MFLHPKDIHIADRLVDHASSMGVGSLGVIGEDAGLAGVVWCAFAYQDFSMLIGQGKVRTTKEIGVGGRKGKTYRYTRSPQASYMTYSTALCELALLHICRLNHFSLTPTTLFNWTVFLSFTYYSVLVALNSHAFVGVLVVLFKAILLWSACQILIK